MGDRRPADDRGPGPARNLSPKLDDELVDVAAMGGGGRGGRVVAVHRGDRTGAAAAAGRAVQIAAGRARAPTSLYLDNGSTYSGEALRLCCERLGITLIHARPYDAPARGKMERFWRTLRAGCLDHLGAVTSLHDVQVRLGAFLDEHYHRAPHGGLMGQAPADAWAGATCRAVDEPALAAALTIHRRRRVRKDGTVDLDGRVWQLDQGFLAGRVVTVVAAHAGLAGDPVAVHDGHRYPLRPADPVAASRTRRRRRGQAPTPTIPFDPAGALLDRAAGRPPRHRGKKP